MSLSINNVCNFSELRKKKKKETKKKNEKKLKILNCEQREIGKRLQ